MKIRGCTAILLTVVLLLTPLGSLAEEQTAMDRVIHDWVNMLAEQDDRYSQEKFALELMLQFCEEPAWDNLIKARTTASFTIELLEYYASAIWEGIATDEDYTELIAQGMDIGDAQFTINGFRDYAPMEITDYILPIWREYAYMLMFSVYEKETVEDMNEHAVSRMDSIQSDLRELYLMTNYIYLELPEKEAEDLTSLVGKYAPTIMAAYERPFETINDVLNEYNALVLEEEERLIDSSESLTRSETQRNSETMSLNAQSIKHLPALLLPYPTVFSAQVNDYDYTYYWKDENGEIQTAMRKMDIQTLPNCFSLTISNIEREQYQAYKACMIDVGLEPDDMNDTAVLFTFEDGILLLIAWDEETHCMQVNVNGGQICLAPDWYIAQITN